MLLLYLSEIDLFDDTLAVSTSPFVSDQEGFPKRTLSNLTDNFIVVHNTRDLEQKREEDFYTEMCRGKVC